VGHRWRDSVPNAIARNPEKKRQGNKGRRREKSPQQNRKGIWGGGSDSKMNLEKARKKQGGGSR